MNITTTNDTYIHYGSPSYEVNKFDTPRNRLGTKPIGGLWGTPINGNLRWDEWCKDNNFREDRLNTSFKFQLAENAKVLMIADEKDLEGCPILNELEERPLPFNRTPHLIVVIDYEKLIEMGIDAVQVCLDKSEVYFLMYGWDCDSIVVLNPNVIKEV